MWVDDEGHFWEYKVKATVDYKARTFSADAVQNLYYDCLVTIKNGKVLENAAKTPSGMPADSIVYFVSFNDDTNPEDYGFSNYKISGFRRSGFSGDDF